VSDFLSTVLPSVGLYCAAGFKAELRQHLYHSTTDDLAENLEQLSATGADVYFALASFAEKSRKAEHATHLRSLFVDIDCGEGKPYADQTAGATFGDTFAKLATTTGATWWVRPTDGMPRWIAPAATRPITATATITLESDDDIGPGQAWMSGATSRPTRVTVSSPAGKVVVVDTVSEAAGAPVSEANLDTFSPTTTSAADPGYARLNQSTRLRLASFSVDLVTAQTDLYTALCGSSFPGMRLTVAGVPSAAFGYTMTDVYAQGWNEHIDSGSYVWKFDTTPADAPSDGRFDDATYGRFAWGDGAATVTGGTAVGTTSNGTLIITTPSGPCLSVSAGSFPLDLDWNGERVTITSAPASSTSPQTVTTTARGVGGTVARIHSTGEAVDIAFAARIAF